MKPLERRIFTLEAGRPAQSRSSGNWDKEFDAMSQDERDVVRAFLVHWKSGSKPGEPEHDRLRRLATDAIFAVRARM